MGKKNTKKSCGFQIKALPLQPQIRNEASLAQLVEQLTLNQWVQSSNL